MVTRLGFDRTLLTRALLAVLPWTTRLRQEVQAAQSCGTLLLLFEFLSDPPPWRALGQTPVLVFPRTKRFC